MRATAPRQLVADTSIVPEPYVLYLLPSGPTQASSSLLASSRYGNVIEFVLLASNEDEAWVGPEVECFAATLGQKNMSASRASQLAEHCEMMSPERAAKFYQAAGNYDKALKLLLACWRRSWWKWLSCTHCTFARD
ncbi:hypothetical protein PR003_g8409 [Phytophthora rubi]|uniref:Uncharacterized protein n=1 Tax=Phytophthora rubi TaxID=129364 RepID=A0A6A4FL98_9STRA|nr:hypothetical protein PR002_g8059 [Phytophthora rubi]KAE9038736.1 hypothetical protein PR001_g7831 [Phytophthora rubi]KAE9344551.1 hypothetical protein PR003_g8409 [Phytophthora rubi]